LIEEPAVAVRRRDQKEESKGGNNRSDSSEASLTREKAKASAMIDYKVPDGEFVSFPEINMKSSQQLVERGIKNLFPIQ
jgi:hypothetical protein